MKRTEIVVDAAAYPSALASFFEGARTYDSSSSREAQVICLEKDRGCFLKSAGAGTLRREAEMTRYFSGKGLSAEVLYYGTENGKDFLLTSRVAGEDCTYRRYLDDPKRLSALLGERLRALHELPYADCPVQDRMRAYLATAEQNFRAGQYDLSYLADGIAQFSADDAYRYLAEHRSELKNEVLLHGDYCLPNVMLDDWNFSGFIDLGAGGVGDRHIDVFWGVWTLRYNLKTDAYRDRFIDAYGRELIDADKLTLVSAAEVFG